METLKKNRYLIIGLVFLFLGLYLPNLLDFMWFNMIVDIRTAIVSGDSGHLVLTAAIWCFFTMVQQVLLLNGIIAVIWNFKFKKGLSLFFFLNFASYILFLILLHYEFSIELELLSYLLSSFVSLLFIGLFTKEKISIGRNIALSLQVFFAFQWLSIIPVLTSYRFGNTDISASIKVASIYLGSASVLQFIGLAFCIALLFSSLITFVLITTYDHNIAMAKENYENQLALDAMRAKAVENRVYEEIHAITHDLKTPLVTIRGLNSLISMTTEKGKVQEYTERIDNATSKMTDMISAFLYESSKQKITTQSIIDYVRAQIPIEDEQLKISFTLEEDLPMLYINKVRVSRAIINIIENAIIVPTNYTIKEIDLYIYKKEEHLAINIRDNGIGIPKSQMEKIWKIGYSTKQTTGLGLAFAKKVIEDNGGSIAIESEENKGTVVGILLPIYEEQAE